MSDVAKQAGVSRQLVSLVLRNAPGPSGESRERVLAAAAALGYRTNAPARLLRQKRTRLIGALYWMRNPFESHLVEELFERAPRRGFGLVLGPVTAERPVEIVAAELLEQRVEALIGFVPDDWTPPVDAVTHVPIVYLGGPVPDADNVHIDNVTGMQVAIEHLAALGHRRIGHLRGDGNAGRARTDAYQAAIRATGLEPEILGDGWGEEAGADLGRRLIAASSRPTAIMCSSDQSAAGLLAVLARGGIRVPEDLSVIGWDDSYVASLSYHNLTSVRQEIAATAEASLDLAIRRLDDPGAPFSTVLTPARLVVRSSTAAPATTG